MNVQAGFPSVARIELRDAVAVMLRNLIFDGEYPAGTRLVETDLAERFGTSRGPVRDAFAELAKSGLVTATARRGTFVSVLDISDVDELYSMRTALEGLAVRRLGDVATTEDFERLDQVLDQLATALRDNDARAAGEADLMFHRCLVALAGHRRLLEAWENLADQTQLLMQELSHVDPEQQGDLGRHRIVLGALRVGDTDAAAAALTEHLATAAETVRRQISTTANTAEVDNGDG
jgi:DNA-binding GntR family transcriptional regulator